MRPVSWQPNWIAELGIRLIERTSSHGTPILVAVIVFVLYWGITAILCGLNGTFVDPRAWNALLDQLGGARISLSWLYPLPELPRMSAAPKQVLYYCHDKTHLIFTCCIMALGFLYVVICRKIETFVKDLHEAGCHITSADKGAMELIYKKYRAFLRAPKWYNFSITRMVLKLTALASGVTAFFFFYDKTHQACHLNECWWGQAQYGNAGLYYSAVIGVLVFFAIEGALGLLAGMAMVNAILRSTHSKPNLFAEDLAHGLSPVGDLALIKFIASLVLGLSIFVIIGLGYFGVENLKFIWFVVVMASAFIPLATIVPMFSAMHLIHLAKKHFLRDLNAFMGSAGHNSIANADTIKTVQPAVELYRHVVDLNAYPFDKNKALISGMALILIAGQTSYNFIKVLGIAP